MNFDQVDLIIRDCTILPLANMEIINDGLIAIKDGKISYVGKVVNAPEMTAENVLESQGKLAMPGLINCHTHLAMTLFRGLAEDITLERWLNETIWPLEAKLKPQDVYIGALLGCLEMIKNGITCFADMYFFEPEVAEAVKKAGLRAVLASAIIEAGDFEKGRKMLKEAVGFAKRYQGYADGRITALLGPHTAFTCSEELLARVREEASKTDLGIHIHIAESKEMAMNIRKERQLSEVEFLEKISFLEDDVLAAHCIHLDEKDIAILVKKGVKVAHNPVANMKLAQGIAKIKELIDAGITVGLGTDGAASNNSLDMFESMKIAAILQKTNYKDPTVLPARKILEMATIKGAEALGLEDQIGSLEVGKKADIILVDLSKPNLTPLHELYANLVYSAHGYDVDSTIVDGKILMENREVKTFNEKEVMEHAQNTAFNLLKR
ncbi:MAG: amidohydrolase [Candidatus Bathyarchaeota archaeon]|nr:MAG: amidohydrolase [Candidatus Bathyarchaeota archaeon]